MTDALTRYCPACYARMAWGVPTCAACGAAMETDEAFERRLTWALDHPDTSVAMVAAEVLAARGAKGAIDRLIEATDSPDPYRAAAAAAALTRFDDARARRALAALMDHPSALVRSAVRR
jgi:HEAT repeat protein